MLPNKKVDKVGNYQLGEMLGKGAIGSVFKGLNIETGKDFKQTSIVNK